MANRFPPLDQSDPRQIASYVLYSRLGAGGMGTVYLSFTPGGRPLALKVVRREYADDPEFRRRFKQEVQAAQRVQGIYTATVLDANTDATVPWLATEYIAGPSLARAVAEHGAFPLFSACRLLAGVAEGLASVHAAGIIHRDLKPANVLLADDGPRVIDFGIARAVDASSITGTGVSIGTPAFMTPEQVNGDPVTPATDVFALGHLVLYAATGHTAFGDGQPSALTHRILHNEPDLDGCPDPLRPFLLRCLAKDPAARPTVAEAVEFARRLMSGQTIRLADASWLPGPVASDLTSYRSALAQQRRRRRTPVRAWNRLLRPAVAVPAAVFVVLIGVIAALAAAKSPSSAGNPGAATPPAATAPATTPAVTTSPATQAASAAPAPGGSGGSPASTAPPTAAPPSTTTYSATEPFPICDTNGASWELVNITPGACQQDMQPSMNNSGYAFDTVSAFPNGTPLSASNTETVTGQIGDDYSPCFGAAEGTASSGYAAVICSDGQWYVNAVTGLGTSDVTVGKQVATGSYPFDESAAYVVSLAFGGGTGTLSINISQGTGSPVKQSFSTGNFTPTVVGIALNSNPPAGFYPSYATSIAGFTFTSS